jgi:hypothetical protein
MNQDYRDVRAMAQVQLKRMLEQGKGPLTSEQIEEQVLRMMEVIGASDVDHNRLVAELEASFATVIGQTGILQSDEQWEPWLPKKKALIGWSFWDRYQSFLRSEEGWAPATLEKLDESTDQILGLLMDPTEPGTWDRRGMIVGDVQSGKTSNYIGLICKAADSGYKLIVVLAGFHNSLRSQTQIRLEEGFLGYDWGASTGSPESTRRRVGVGLFDSTVPRANTITTRRDNGDFNRQVANNFAIGPGEQPLLFVVKKNNSVLRNLISWVKGAALGGGQSSRVRNVPILVIDDEADQGSVDTGLQEFNEAGEPDPEHDPRPINRSIRTLLHLFDQSAYVGYTATPFANIFIHERAATGQQGEDLFPRSFIISLPTPSNHVGPATVFGYETDDGDVVEGLPVVREVTDHLDAGEEGGSSGWMPPKHRKEHQPLFEGEERVPPSLRKAVRAFVLVCAARLARGQVTDHNSMLVHVTRFTAVQGLVAEQVQAELKDLERRFRYGEGDSRRTVESEMRHLWEEDFVPTSEQLSDRGLVDPDFVHPWRDIQGHLLPAVSSITVRIINGLAGEVLDYINHKDAGLNVIAVGGDKLSRGLTLEGLSISYFLRASKMYDTLMQMGRWFGYREGYLDLCRLYTTSEMEEWFSHIAQASDELREDFDRMVASGGTPRDFGHRVRSHPTLLVTSQVKMRHGQAIDLTYDGDVSETINFWRDSQSLTRNMEAAVALLNACSQGGERSPEKARNGSTASMWGDVNAETVISFLRAYREHNASRRVKTSLLADYIESELRVDRLSSWTVALASGGGSKEQLGPVDIELVERAWHTTETMTKERLVQNNHYRIKRLLNPPDEAADLDLDEYKKALERTRETWKERPKGRKEPTEPSGWAMREVRDPSKGLLLLYPLDGTKKVEGDLLVIGFGISFPTVKDGTASKVRYQVSNLYYQQEVVGTHQDLDR